MRWLVDCLYTKETEKKRNKKKLVNTSFNSWLTLTTLIRQANLYLSLPFRKQDKGAQISGLLKGGGGRGVWVNGGGYALIL